jgi:hypothetical protein
MNILILAGGDHRRSGGLSSYPPWLSEIDGTLLLERQSRVLRISEHCRLVYVFRQDDIAEYALSSIISQIDPGASIVSLRKETAGAACTALLAIAEIDSERELVVASATDRIDVDFASVVAEFRSKGADAGVLTFPSLHPRYSYVRAGTDGWIIESAEKRPISRSASTGLYWFAKASDFFRGAMEMISKDAHVHGSFYICPILNQLILEQKKIAFFELAQDQYHPVKSEKQVDHLESLMVESSN